jgi:hypothetical protein
VLHPLSLAGVLIYSSSGKWAFPNSCEVFLPLLLLQAFPLLVAGWGPPLLPSLAGLFIYSSCGKWAFPSSSVEFPPTATFTSFPAPGCWAGAAAPSFSDRLVYLQFHGGLSLPHSSVSGHPALFAMCLFCCCLLFSFSFFPGGGSVCPWGYADLAQDCLWEYCVPLSSPCGLCLPKRSGHWHLVVQKPSWFLRLMWSGNATRGLGVWRSQSFASSLWFFL